MGGLLEDWDTMPQFDKRHSNEQFLTELWDAESERFKIGLDSKIWKKNAIQSSYPCCIAYYAVLEQGKEKAEKFLRNLREFLFICGKDISQNAAISTCAINSEIDLAGFFDAIDSGRAEAQFKKHLETKKLERVKHFPSFIMENDNGERKKILNITDYKFFDEVLHKLDNYLNELTDGTIFKKRQFFSPIQLLHKFKFLSLKQLETICEQDNDLITHELEAELANGTVICEWHGGYAHYKINETPYHIKRGNLEDSCAILGGGICGGFLKIAMDKAGVNSLIFEKQRAFKNRGFGFLLLQNGIEAMDSIGLKNRLFKMGNHMNIFRAVKPDESLIFEKNLENCLAITREGLHEIFRDLIPEKDLRLNKEFSSFHQKGDKQVVHFTDGTNYTAELYAGVDGIRSTVRGELFGEQLLTEVGEREIVCMVEAQGLPFQLDEFYKVIDSERGKTIGIIPLTGDVYIWFLQFNHKLDPCETSEADVLKEFTIRSIEDFPSKVKDLVSQSNFESAFLWISQRMDHLPSYFKENCVLLGDAAHPLLPLTSQGANSALEDAASLATVWSNYRHEVPVSEVLRKYQDQRRAIIAHYIADGDALAEDFMLLSSNKKFKLPLTIH
jgi:2-polyprenyl-6-methoxyphenol hydroxylase-like FAD-dependent oxidoreductase/predicted DsbA family dithiol-disulfide isomerase